MDTVSRHAFFYCRYLHSSISGKIYKHEYDYEYCIKIICEEMRQFVKINLINFRALNCGRIKMHKNLFTSLTLNNMCWIIWLLDILLGQGIHSAENPVSFYISMVLKTLKSFVICSIILLILLNSRIVFACKSF